MGSRARKIRSFGQPGLHEKLVSKNKTKPKQYKVIVYMTLKEVEPSRAEGLPWLLYLEDRETALRRHCSLSCTTLVHFDAVSAYVLSRAGRASCLPVFTLRLFPTTVTL